jgi:archaellum biogenesis ATPase FlaH
LKALITTTETASHEIETCLLEAKAGSERLEKLVVAANLAQVEQESTLKLVEQNAEKTSIVLDAVTNTVGAASSQLVRLFSLNEHLERWIKAVVQYCNEIIGLVQRNTHILLSLHDVVTRLESAMRVPGVNCPVLEFENPFGIKMALPFQMCDTWEV